MLRTDVLVIGGGVSGLLCAERAAKDCDVILICDGMGASPYIHGINVPLFDEDSVECFVEDTLKSGRYQNNKKLVHTMCSKSTELVKRFDFDKDEDGYKLLKPLGSTYPRVASIKRKTGVSVINSIDKSAFRIFGNMRLLRLKKEGDRVVGAYCFDKAKNEGVFISAKAVVAAGGGFGGLFKHSTNSPDIAGDMIAAAYDIGSELVDMEFIQFEPSAAVYPKALVGKSVITTMFYEGAVLLNKDKKRFTDECVNKDVLSAEIFKEINKGNGTKNKGVYFDATGVDESLLTGCYIDYYNRYIKFGIDITKTPFEIAPMPHTTLGGIKIDEKCRTNINGLFACGEATGGLHGANRLGGNAGLEVMIFGTIAAESAVNYVNAARYETIDCEFKCSYGEKQQNDVIEKALYDGLNVIRNEKALKKAIADVEGLIYEIGDRQNNFQAMRLYNDAICAYIALSCALKRTESVGCHIRDDGVESGEKYSLVASKKDNALQIEKREINE